MYITFCEKKDNIHPLVILFLFFGSYRVYLLYCDWFIIPINNFKTKLFISTIAILLLLCLEIAISFAFNLICYNSFCATIQSQLLFHKLPERYLYYYV